jgi:CelD/BcsL family acetyltransferase involved in cellulose biosynthesis
VCCRLYIYIYIYMCVCVCVCVENRSNKKRRKITGETFFVDTEEQRDALHSERFVDVRQTRFQTLHQTDSYLSCSRTYYSLFLY